MNQHSIQNPEIRLRGRWRIVEQGVTAIFAVKATGLKCLALCIVILSVESAACLECAQRHVTARRQARVTDRFRRSRREGRDRVPI